MHYTALCFCVSVSSFKKMYHWFRNPSRSFSVVVFVNVWIRDDLNWIFEIHDVQLTGNVQLFSSLSLRTLHQQFESYKQEVRRIGADTQRQHTQQKDDTPTCGICRKTKFADGCGHHCSYCQTKFCARCGGRVSLRSNNVRNLTSDIFFLHLVLTSFRLYLYCWSFRFCVFVDVCFFVPWSHFGKTKVYWENGLAPVIGSFLKSEAAVLVLWNGYKVKHLRSLDRESTQVTASVLSCVSCDCTAAIKPACPTVTVLLPSSNMS